MLHQKASLDWLRALLDTGAKLLTRGVDSYTSTSTSARSPVMFERQLLWLLEVSYARRCLASRPCL